MKLEDWTTKCNRWDKSSHNGAWNVGESSINNGVHKSVGALGLTIHQSTQKAKRKTSSSPAYPEGYDIIDRRRRRKSQVPGALVNTETERPGDIFNPGVSLLRHKRGEFILRQLAEMEEDEEQTTPCLKPYKNGLFYKTRIRTKNRSDNSFESYVASNRSSLDLSSEGSDEVCDPEDELEKSLACHRFGSQWSCDERYWDNKFRRAKIAGWTPEVMLSPVEEPSKQFVDPMDELQCLVETVSEYLAEKEEEISKYGSLSSVSKSRLSSQNSNRTDSLNDEQSMTSKDLKEDKPQSEVDNPFELDTTAKNAMNLFFSSFTDKVGTCLKQPRSNSEESKTDSGGSFGLSKMFSFMTRSPSPAVVVVSPTQEASPKRSLQDLIMQNQINHPKIPNQENITTETLALSSGNSLIDTLQKNGNHTISSTLEDIMSDGKQKPLICQPKAQSVGMGGKMETEFTSPAPQSFNTKPGKDLEFLSPLKKSLSSVVSPVPPETHHDQTQTVYPVFRLEKNAKNEKHMDASTTIKALSSTSAQKLSKSESGILSGLFANFGLNDNIAERTDGTDTIEDDSASSVSSEHPEHCRSYLPKNAKHFEKQPKRITDTSWFSSLFKTAPSESVTAAGKVQNPEPASESNQNISTQQIHNRQHNSHPVENHISNNSSPQMGHSNLFSGLFKSSSSKDTSVSAAGKNPLQSHSISGVIKAAAVDDVTESKKPDKPRIQTKSQSQTNLSNVTHDQQRASSPLQSGHQESSRFLSSENIPPKKVTLNYPSQQPLSPQQVPSEQGVFSSLFKLAFSDNLSNTQNNILQHHFSNASQESKIINDHLVKQTGKVGDSGPQHIYKQSGILSELTNIDIVSARRSEVSQHKYESSNQTNIHKCVNTLTRSSLKSTSSLNQKTQEESKSGVLSNIFNKFSSSPEDAPCKELSSYDQKEVSSKNVSLGNHLITQEATDKTSKQKSQVAFLSKPEESLYLMPKKCENFLNNAPVYTDDRLDLRTSTSQVRSQPQMVYISKSVCHLPQSSLNTTHAKNISYSTDNLYLPTSAQVLIPQQCLERRDPSLHNDPQQYSYQNDFFLNPNYALNYSSAHSLEGQLIGTYQTVEPVYGFCQSSPKDCHMGLTGKSNVQRTCSNQNTLEMINSVGAFTEQEGVLNLSKKDNKHNSSQYLSMDSCFSLNSVSHHEGYCVGNVQNLTYFGNRDYIIGKARQPGDSDYPGRYDSRNSLCPSTTHTDIEDYGYFEESEWYQQWLSLLEQGMWWPDDYGDCGYFVYSDHEYIYALLTDGSGQYVYVCAPEEELWDNRHMADDYPIALFHNEMVILCGFKIPLFNEDELLWLPGQHQNECHLLNVPLDLCDALKKGNDVMNLNLERFSQMFESSIPAQMQHAMDFSSYRLNKLSVNTSQEISNVSVHQDPSLEVLDLTIQGANSHHSSVNCKGMKELLSQKVCITSTSNHTSASDKSVYTCYQPCLRRCSSTEMQIKHIDDTSEEEWRKHVLTPEEQSKMSPKKLPSILSSLAKSHEFEVDRKPQTSSFVTNVMCAAPNTLQTKGVQRQSQMILKEEDFPPVTQSQIIEKQASVHVGSSTCLSKTPTTSASFKDTTPKPKLARQATVSQQSLVRATSLAEVPATTGPASSVSAQKQSQLSQQGTFLSFLKTAMGIDESNQDTVKASQVLTNLTQPEERNKENKGITILGGSVGDSVNVETSFTHLPPKNTSLSQTSTNQPFDGYARKESKPELIQTTLTQIKCNHGNISSNAEILEGSQAEHIKSAFQIPSSKCTNKLVQEESQSMASKPENVKKSTSLLSFSIGDIFSGNTLNKDEPSSKSILSLFSDYNVQQESSQIVSASQCEAKSGSSKNATSGRILSFFGSKTEHGAVQTPEISPSKDTLGIGFLSLFSDRTQQKMTQQTGSSSKILNVGAALPNESPGASSQSKPTIQSSNNKSPQHHPPTQIGSVFGGILGSFSNSNGRANDKDLFSGSGGSSPQPLVSPQTNTEPAPVAPTQRNSLFNDIQNNKISDGFSSQVTKSQHTLDEGQYPQNSVPQLEQFSGAKYQPSMFSCPSSVNEGATNGLFSEQPSVVCVPLPSSDPVLEVFQEPSSIHDTLECTDQKTSQAQPSTYINATPYSTIISNLSGPSTTLSSTATATTAPNDSIAVLETSATLNISQVNVTPEHTSSISSSLVNENNSQSTTHQTERGIFGGFFSGNTVLKDTPGTGLFSSSSPKTSCSSSSKDLPGKSLFSMLGGSGSAQPQTSSSSLFGDILSRGISAKDISGKGLLSMFGNSNPEPAPIKTAAMTKSTNQASKDIDPKFDVLGIPNVPLSVEKKVELQKIQNCSESFTETDNERAEKGTISPDDTTQNVEDENGINLLKQNENISQFTTELVTLTVDRKAHSLSSETVCTTGLCLDSEHEICSQPKQKDTTTTKSVTTGTANQQCLHAAEKSVFDSSAEVVSDFMSKMFSGFSEPSETSSLHFDQTQFLSGSSSHQISSPFTLSSFSSDSKKTTEVFHIKSQKTTESTKSTLPSKLSVKDQTTDNSSLSGVVLELGFVQQPEQNLEDQNSSEQDVNPPEAILDKLDNDTEGPIVIEKPVVVVEELEEKVLDHSGLSEPPSVSEPSQSMFSMSGFSPLKFGFIPGSEDAKKSFGSLFSSPPSMPKDISVSSQTDSGFLSGFKSFSTGFFQKEKPLASRNEPTASLFGEKLGFLWQKDAPVPPNQQVPLVVTTKPQHQTVEPISVGGSAIIEELVVNLESSGEDIKTKSTDQNMETCKMIDSTSSIDYLSQNEQDTEIQPPTLAAFSGLQLDYREHLSAKRLVAS